MSLEIIKQRKYKTSNVKLHNIVYLQKVLI